MLTMSSDIHVWYRSTKQNKEQATTKNNKRGISRNEAEGRGKMAVLQVLHLPVCDAVV